MGGGGRPVCSVDGQQSGGLALLPALPLLHCVTLSRAFPSGPQFPQANVPSSCFSTITTGTTNITL